MCRLISSWALRPVYVRCRQSWHQRRARVSSHSTAYWCVSKGILMINMYMSHQHKSKSVDIQVRNARHASCCPVLLYGTLVYLEEDNFGRLPVVVCPLYIHIRVHARFPSSSMFCGFTISPSSSPHPTRPPLRRSTRRTGRPTVASQPVSECHPAALPLCNLLEFQNHSATCFTCQQAHGEQEAPADACLLPAVRQLQGDGVGGNRYRGR